MNAISKLSKDVKAGNILYAPLDGAATICLLFVAMTYWLVCHRYEGIYHDAVLYNLIAAHRLYPQIYAQDLFFVFGSQGDFSVFPFFFSELMSWFGLDLANRAALLAGAGLWVAVLVLIAKDTLIFTVPAFLAVLLTITKNYSYSLNGSTFVLNENFLTARSWAFPVALLAIWYFQRGNRAKGVATAIVATSIHPLLGIWSLLLLSAQLVSDRFIAVCGILLAGLLAALVITDASPIFAIMDPAWAERVSFTSADVFVDGAGHRFSLDKMLFWISACWIGGRYANVSYRRLYLLISFFSAVSVFASQVCSKWWPVHIVMEAQPSRVIWLAIVFGTLALIDCGWQVYLKGHRFHLWLLLLGVVVYAVNGDSGAILLTLVTIDLLWGLQSAIKKLEQVTKGNASYLIIGFIVMLLPSSLLSLEMDGVAIGTAWLDDVPALKGFIFGGGGLIFLIFGVIASHPQIKKVLLVCFIPLAAYAFSTWDARTQRLTNLEASYAPGGNGFTFSQQIKKGEVVAWPDHAMDIWFLLGTADYADTAQAAGILFSKQKTEESLRRFERVATARAHQTEGEMKLVTSPNLIDLHETNKGPLRPNGIIYLCQDPILDWVISNSQLVVNGRSLALSSGLIGGVTTYLYDCRSLRAKQL